MIAPTDYGFDCSLNYCLYNPYKKIRKSVKKCQIILTLLFIHGIIVADATVAPATIIFGGKNAIYFKVY